jgi:hypothetical protein
MCLYKASFLSLPVSCCRFFSHHPSPCKAGASAGRQDSSSEAGLASWVSSMSAVWRNLGVASAKGPGEGGSSSSGPSTKELKDNIQWDVSVGLVMLVLIHFLCLYSCCPARTDFGNTAAAVLRPISH